MSRRTARAKGLTWHSLVGSKVIDCDGKLIDHCIDLVARPVDDRLTVTHLLVGRRALFARMSLARWFDFGRGRLEIPWEKVATIGDDVIHVSMRRDEVGHTDKRADATGAS